VEQICQAIIVKNINNKTHNQTDSIKEVASW